MQNFNQYHFKGQRDGEEILMVVHRHWFDILSQFFIILLMLLVVFGSLLFASPILNSMNGALSVSLFLFLENIMLIGIWLLFFIVWIDYYFDVWIVTSERIVNIEQKGLFSRDVSELKLENVQDITVEVLGIIPTFLNYGDLYIQTAGELERFIFKHVPNPYAIKDLVMNLQKKYEADEKKEIGSIIEEQIHNGLH